MDISTGDKQFVNKKNRDWHAGLHLRKTVVQPPTMQSEDKNEPKKIAEEWEHSTVWTSSMKSTQEAQQCVCGTNDSRITLRFTCSQCRDNLEYFPKDLVKHFEEKHRGSLPVFSCHTCTFNTHEFSSLQVHLLSHKDTFSSCSICNDNVQRTWSEFSAHLTLHHCPNGKYSCELCHKFSTGDVQLFLGHIYAHNLGLEEANDILLHPQDKNQFGPKTTTQMMCCQHCGYEASQKWLLTKHINAVHVRPNGNKRRRRRKKGINSLAMKPNDPIPKMKPRLTRSTVREMCWLTQDCLSLPGREFLDKYCHLSDPQTTLEETQQFLMKSVTGETDDQKWTKALKTVLSNVPQEMNLHPRSENSIMLNPSDLTFLTLKNRITVAQNGATYTKKLKRMTSPDIEAVFPETVANDAYCVVDQNGCQSNLNAQTLCAQTEIKQNNDVSVSAQNKPFEIIQMQENRENRDLKVAQEEHSKHQESMNEDGIHFSTELKLTNESVEQTAIYKVLPKNKRRNRRRKRNRRSKKVAKRSGLALKLVLKKNPVKEKQWVSQSSLSTSGGGLTDHRLPNHHKTMEKTALAAHNVSLTAVHQKKGARASKPDLHYPSEAITSSSPVKRGEELSPSTAARPMGSKNMDGNESIMLEGPLSTHQERQNDPEKSVQFLETEVDRRSSAGKTGRSYLRATAETFPENIQLAASAGGTECHVSEDEESSAADGVTSSSTYTKCSSVSQPVNTSQGMINLEDASLTLSKEQSDPSVALATDRHLLADSCSGPLNSTLLPFGKDIHEEPSPASGHQGQPVPKNLERTLKLLAVNPSQLVKRPVGDQPVVVLNHPDADIPEVARIMEVVNRYRGEVQKVILSRRTLNALSARNGEVPNRNDLTDTPLDSTWHGKNSVQERFILKMKLRRLSRKKYEVVGAGSPSRDVATKFCCWFCGRTFTSQEMWMGHQQRHLMEWKKPNCENS
ncbi:uncharacterized protein znf518a [Mastacembelus armatus]|uniref:Uncharacterized LOC113131427 n=1 Tax=Mastacembelus armatus TaxID=205130 RepID=A0A3Q3MCT7_9TELE|nr:uncharacterized protein LOC113131427 [Mastacembelus armatus]